MIRGYQEKDLDQLMKIWLDSNIKTHDFISSLYWMCNFDSVKEQLPQAELYIYEDKDTHEILGFIGIINDYIAGIFVCEDSRSQGIGKQLLDYVKSKKEHLSLTVYKKNERAILFYQREDFLIQSQQTEEHTDEIEYQMSWTKSIEE